MGTTESTEAVGRRRRLPRLAVALAALVTLVGAGTAIAAVTISWPTSQQEIASTGIQSSIPFCGTKPITLGIEDGFGINTWSQESYAAVRSEAAK